MMNAKNFVKRISRLVLRFHRDRKAASAVEFALVSAPFFFLLLGVLQLGIFYMSQSALDTGVLKTAEVLRSNFTTGSTANLLDGATLRSNVVTFAGSLVNNDTTLSVEIRPLTSLNSAVTPVTNGTVDYGTTTSVLVLRAQSQVVNFAPGLSGLNVIYSSAIVRRQGT